MDQTTHEIEAHIQRTRGDLTSNLQELENRVKSAADWKKHFQENPTPMLAAALGGGIFLGMIMGGGRRKFVGGPGSQARYGMRRPGALDSIIGAFIAVGAKRLTEFLGEVVPPFRKQDDSPPVDPGVNPGSRIRNTDSH